jgi:hypothetical protein
MGCVLHYGLAFSVLLKVDLTRFIPDAFLH